MIKRIILAIIFGTMAFGVASCAQSEPEPAGEDSESEVVFEGPAFVLFFTDP